MIRYKAVPHDEIEDMHLVYENVDGMWVECPDYGVGDKIETAIYVKRMNMLHEMREIRDDPEMSKAEKLEEMREIKRVYER